MAMDEDQARAALTEVERRRTEATRIATREGAPAWFVAVGVVVLLAIAMQTDLRSLYPDWNGWFARWGVPILGILVMVVCGVIVHRRAAMAAHRSRFGEQMTTAVVGLVVWYGFTLAIGMPMRYFRVPFDQTVSAVGGALLALAVWAVWRRYRARRG